MIIAYCTVKQGPVVCNNPYIESALTALCKLPSQYFYTYCTSSERYRAILYFACTVFTDAGSGSGEAMIPARRSLALVRFGSRFSPSFAHQSSKPSSGAMELWHHGFNQRIDILSHSIDRLFPPGFQVAGTLWSTPYGRESIRNTSNCTYTNCTGLITL